MNRVLIILTMMLGAFAFAQEPYHIQQDVLGEPLAIYQQNTNECPTPKLVPRVMGKVQVCEVNASTFAGAKFLKKHVSFLHGHLYLVTMTFDHADFDGLIILLSDKFGPPTKERTTDRAVLVTTAEVMRKEEMTQEQRENVPLTSHTKEWTNGVSTIYLSEYDTSDPTFRTSSVAFTLDELSNEVRDNITKSSNESRSKANSESAAN